METINSITKVTDTVVVDIILVRAIAFDEDTDIMSIYFMRHDDPMDIDATLQEYKNFYTKWKNYAQWRLDMAMMNSYEE